MFFVWCGKGRSSEKCVISRGKINKEYKENYMLLNKFLGFEPENMKVKTEIVAGATTFFTMSYILAVNPMILSTTGMDKAGVFTATAIASAIATILLAFMAKLPFAQAPSMGLNAFFAFTLCQGMGFTWQQSLAALLVEGLIFLLITFFNVRELILKSIPTNLRYAISVGIGMFIAFIGLKNAGIIVANPATIVGLGSFTPTSILGIIAIIMSGVLMARKIKGFLYIISSHPLGDAVDVNGSTEKLINVPFAVIVLASNTTHWYLVAFGGGVEPRLLDLIKGHHFLTRIIVKHFNILFPFCRFLVLCWLFCFCLFTELALAGRNHTLVGITLKHLLYIRFSNECHSAAQS